MTQVSRESGCRSSAGLPRTVVDLDLDLGDASRPGVGDAADGYVGLPAPRDSDLVATVSITEVVFTAPSRPSRAPPSSRGWSRGTRTMSVIHLGCFIP